jgi:HlyD family secretion protein
MRTVFGVLLVIGLAVVGAAYYTLRMSADPPATFRTATVKRGDLQSTISATGTVEAEEFVDVGAQVVGPIKEFGVDPSELAKFKREKKRDPTAAELKAIKRIDYGSVVQEGTILAQIDDSVYKAQVDQARAALVRAKADLKQMEAKVITARALLEQGKAKLKQAEQDWKRAQRLRPDRAAAENKPTAETKSAMQPKPAAGKKAPAENPAASAGDGVLEYRAMSDADYDSAKASYELYVATVAAAEADLAAAEANVGVGEAAITQSEAALRLAQRNLDYTTIQSPVDGTIIDRRVNVGQTVVATFSAASLFLIAKDLRRVQVWASVNEADIGRIKPGLPVRFTVDAFPGEVFRGKVDQIRLNAQMTQNVVTYTVVVETDNSNLRLMPYLTANLQFEVDQRKDVLLVPNQALRWKPRPEQVVPDARATVSAGSSKKGGGEGSKGGDQPGKGSANPASAGDAKGAKPAKEREDRGRLWVRDGNYVRPVEVQVGMSDGSQTEVSGAGIDEGTEVVIGELRKEEVADGGDTTNPFAPKLFRGGQKKSQ